MKTQTYHPIPGEVFHVHTYRCKHAGATTDRDYIEKAVELGAPRIVFTDHAPFPGNPFGNRMGIEQLPEYVETLSGLREEYRGKIEIMIGLEAEYLPSFAEYLHELKNDYGLDLLIMGQHFFELEPGRYSFSDEDKTEEYIGLCKAMTLGLETCLFDVVSHPDRAFRRRKYYGDDEVKFAKELMNTASFRGVYLEINYSSMHRKRQFWYEFWSLLPEQAMMIYGIDAHSVEDIEGGMTEYYKAMNIMEEDVQTRR